jgi:predicted Zn-ribbon and HTH transcriptional regulator
MSGKIKLPHVCPKCQVTTANTAQEVNTLFGFRTKESGVTNQSHCRKCRSGDNSANPSVSG